MTEFDIVNSWMHLNFALSEKQNIVKDGAWKSLQLTQVQLFYSCTLPLKNRAIKAIFFVIWYVLLKIHKDKLEDAVWSAVQFTKNKSWKEKVWEDKSISYLKTNN